MTWIDVNELPLEKAQILGEAVEALQNARLALSMHRLRALVHEKGISEEEARSYLYYVTGRPTLIKTARFTPAVLEGVKKILEPHGVTIEVRDDYCLLSLPDGARSERIGFLTCYSDRQRTLVLAPLRRSVRQGVL